MDRPRQQQLRIGGVPLKPTFLSPCSPDLRKRPHFMEMSSNISGIQRHHRHNFLCYSDDVSWENLNNKIVSSQAPLEGCSSTFEQSNGVHVGKQPSRTYSRVFGSRFLLALEHYNQKGKIIVSWFIKISLNILTSSVLDYFSSSSLLFSVETLGSKWDQKISLILL